MPSAFLTTDELLANNTVINDPYLSVALTGGYLYRIEALLDWNQPAGGNGGIQAGLSIDDPNVDLRWLSQHSGSSQIGYTSGNTIGFNTASGRHMIYLQGKAKIGANTTARVKRAQVNTDAIATELKAFSLLTASVIVADVTPPELTALPVFTAPINQQGYNVPIPSPIGTTALLGTASQAVIARRPTRRGIAFINPSGSTNIYVCPDNQTAVPGQGLVVLPGVMVPIMGNDNNLINVTCGWNACAESGSSVPLSILEFV